MKFLWPLLLPRPEGRIDSWSRSAMQAAAVATRKWVRVYADHSAQAYGTQEAVAALGEPDWNWAPMDDLLLTAFDGRYTDSTDHPVLRRLRGEV